MQDKLKEITKKIPNINIITFIVIFIIIFSRYLGWFQPLEYKLLDIFFKLRPSEKTDSRIIVVKITEADINKFGYPISDQKLALALTKIKNQHPRAIGLDIVRDIPQEPGHEQLIKVFKTTPNLWGIEKILGQKFSIIAPPPVLKNLAQVASSDTVPDSDGVVRRTLLFPETNTKTLTNLGLALAIAYLQKQSIEPTDGKDNYLQLNKTLFVPFPKNKKGKSNAGGYINMNAGGYKILLNYRGKPNSFEKISLIDLLNNNISPSLFTDRIVLIGYEAPSVKDEFFTPYSFNNTKTPVYTSGVEINANVASMVISSVLDNRPLLKTSNELSEYILIIFASGVFPWLIWKWQKVNIDLAINKYLFVKLVASLVAGLVCIGGSYFAFLYGWWIPVGIPITGLLVSNITIAGYVLLRKTYQSYSLAIQSEIRMNLAISAAGMETFEWNLETNLIAISDNLSRFLGNEIVTVITKDEFFSCINLEDKNKVELEIQKSINNKTECNIEFRVSKIGEDIWIKVKGKPIYGSNNIAEEINGLFWDISEIKKLNIRADKINSVWQTLTKNVSESIIVVRREDWLINYLNLQSENFLGYSKNDVKMTSFLEYIFFEDKEWVAEKVDLLLPGDQITLQYKIEDEKGDYHTFESIFCNLSDDSEINGILINSRDITELVNAKASCGNMVSKLEEFMISPE